MHENRGAYGLKVEANFFLEQRMFNKNVVSMITTAICILSGFICGWQLKGCTYGINKSIKAGGSVLRICDTIKIAEIEYKTIPGTEINIDSLESEINQYWRDSLKNLYGKGLFEASFIKEDKQKKEEINLESRIPIDPEAKIAIGEEITLPELYSKRTLGIYGGLGYEGIREIAGEIGIKYYLLDYKNFSIETEAEGQYLIKGKAWDAGGRIELELKF